MSLSLSKLENVLSTDNKTTARCPACAEAGGDKCGDHLFVNDAGKYGCIKFPGPDGAEHRKRIFALAGVQDQMKDGSGSIVAEYNYQDADGNDIFQVVRFEPKDFRQRRSDGKGGWLWTLAGIKRELYHLPEVITAKHAGNLIVTCEGEKDADAVRLLGLSATCNAGGAGKWEPQYTETLAGADVVIILDKDEAGRNHGRVVAPKLHGKVKSLKVIELPDRAGRKTKDAFDWIHAGGTLEELNSIIEQTATYQPTEDSPTETTPTANLQPGNWPELTPLNYAAETPPFPVETLPEPFQTFCREVAESFQVPLDLPACLALGVAALSCAKRFKVEIGCTHTEPLNLYILPLMEPGERKSSTFREILQPVETHQQELCEAAKPEIARATERRSLAEARLSELRKRAAKEEDHASRAAMSEEIQTLAESLPIIPTMPRLICGDVTQEKLGGLLHENGERIAQVDAEGGAFFNLIGGQYSKAGGANFEIYLRAHAGDSMRVDRVGRTGEDLREPALTLILTGQPSLIAGLQNREALKGRGLLARFLFSLPRSMVGQRGYANRPIDAIVRAEYRQAVRRMLETSDIVTAENPAAYRPLKITGEALKVWVSFYNATETELAPDGKLFHVRDWASKLAGAAARIAGLLHVMAGNNEPEIPPATLAAGWAVGQYFTAHALAAFEIIGGAHDEMPRRLLAYIQRHQLRAFKLSAAFDDLRKGMPDGSRSEDLISAVEVLEARGYVRPVTGEVRQGAGRKASPVFEVNPAFLGVNRE